MPHDINFFVWLGRLPLVRLQRYAVRHRLYVMAGAAGSCYDGSPLATECRSRVRLDRMAPSEGSVCAME